MDAEVPAATPSLGRGTGQPEDGRIPMIRLVELDDSVPFPAQLQETTGPVTLMNLFVAPEGQVDTVLAVWAGAAKLMKAKPGFISTQMHRGTGNSRVLVNMAVWESSDLFRQAFASPDLQHTLSQYPDGTVVMPHVLQKVGVAGICVP
ncbi:MAG: antibiotic biosynthesis monooxygenase family protein [Pseudonocardiaceae bacterium]